MLNLDRSIFAAFSYFRHDNGYEALVDPALTRDQVIQNIAEAQFGFENIVKVVEFNAVEGWSRDVTDEILLAAAIIREGRGLQAAE